MTLTTTDIVELTAELKALGVECFRYGELEVRFRDGLPQGEPLFSTRSIELGPSPLDEEGGKPASRQIPDEDLFFSVR